MELLDQLDFPFFEFFFGSLGFEISEQRLLGVQQGHFSHCNCEIKHVNLVDSFLNQEINGLSILNLLSYFAIEPNRNQNSEYSNVVSSRLPSLFLMLHEFLLVQFNIPLKLFQFERHVLSREL